MNNETEVRNKRANVMFRAHLDMDEVRVEHVCGTCLHGAGHTVEWFRPFLGQNVRVRRGQRRRQRIRGMRLWISSQVEAGGQLWDVTVTVTTDE